MQPKETNRQAAKCRPGALGVLYVVGVLLSCAAQALAQGALEARAFLGEPFGVGEIEINVPRETIAGPLGFEGLTLTEANGRICYPAVERRPMAGLVRDVMQMPLSPRGKIYFLFRGEGTLEIKLQGAQRSTLRVVPENNRSGLRRALTDWWKHFTEQPGVLAKEPDYPPLVHTYLRLMLARRLNRPPPAADAPRAWEQEIEDATTMSLLGESPRMALVRQRLLDPGAWSGTADQPLPAAHVEEELLLPAPAAKVEVEPIAMRVPAECLYARFGSFSNFLWFQDTLARWGGDLQNLLALRGLDRDTRGQIERRLVLETTALARLVGEAIVKDVAFVALDAEFEDGAAFGLLFQARNNTIFSANLAQARAARLKAGDGAIEQQATLEGIAVSLLTTPDGAVRSYHAADGDFHLVATSETLVRRFLATGKGQDALGGTAEFRHARSVMPLAREDAVFVYLSDAMFHNQSTPRYRIERARRMAAATDIVLVELARLAAASEGQPANTIDELVAGGFLPSGFGPRSDGSRAVLSNGEVSDSLRGRRGSFLPVPDVLVKQVTRAEAEHYGGRADGGAQPPQSAGPVLLGVTRKQLGARRERVVLDVAVSPLAASAWQRLARRVGRTDGQALAPLPGDLAALEMILADGRLFGGISELHAPVRWTGGAAMVGFQLRDAVVGYIGSRGRLGWLGMIEGVMNGPPDPAGFSRGYLGLWRRQYQGYTLYSFQREVLEQVAPQLRLIDAEPAQLRLRMGDVSQGPLASTLNDVAYARTRQTSMGNLRLLHAMQAQLHVPEADARERAEKLLGAKLVCPLGGEYVYRGAAAEDGHWTSTALEGSAASALRAPAGFLAPPLSWFRGLELHASATAERASAHIEVDMEWPGEGGAAQ